MADNSFHPAINPYHVLQIRHDATPSEIREAYRRLSLLHHPGRRRKDHHGVGKNNNGETSGGGGGVTWSNSGSTTAAATTATAATSSRSSQIFQAIAASYETLLDNDARERFDMLWMQDQQYRIFGGTVRGEILVGGKRIMEAPSRSRSRNTARTNTTQDESDDGAMSVLMCTSFLSGSTNDGSDTLPSLMSSNASSESSDEDALYGPSSEKALVGPLWMMLKARQYRPFTDPLVLFERIFGSRIYRSQPPPHPATQQQFSHTASLEVITRAVTEDDWRDDDYVDGADIVWNKWTSPSNWQSNTTRLPDGTILTTTTRIRDNRRLTRTETVKINKQTGKRETFVTVEAFEIPQEDPTAGTPLGCCGCGPMSGFNNDILAAGPMTRNCQTAAKDCCAVDGNNKQQSRSLVLLQTDSPILSTASDDSNPLRTSSSSFDWDNFLLCHCGTAEIFSRTTSLSLDDKERQEQGCCHM